MSGTASKTNVYISGGTTFQVENKTGGTCSYRITIFKMGNE